MNGRERFARLQVSLVAASAGWLAAIIVTLPMVLFDVWTKDLGGWRSLAWSLAAGAWVWLAWTVPIAFGAWLLGALPAIALVREDWLLRHKRLAALLSAALAELVVLARFEVWRWLDPLYYPGWWLFSLYSLLLAVFAASAAGTYLRAVGHGRLAAINGFGHRPA